MILYGRSYKKLREEYKHLGEFRLDALEQMAISDYEGLSLQELSSRFDAKLSDMEESKVKDSLDYYIKYKKLMSKRGAVQFAIISGLTLGIGGVLIAKCGKVAVEDSKLQEQYKKGITEGRQRAMKDLDNFVEENADYFDNGEVYIGDSANGKHMLVRLTTEATESYLMFKDEDDGPKLVDGLG